jgi:hypothetical protein
VPTTVSSTISSLIGGASGLSAPISGLKSKKDADGICPLSEASAPW